MMSKNNIYCFRNHFFSGPQRLVFHEKPHPEHEKREEAEKPKKTGGIPIDVEEPKKGPSENVLESEKLFHSDYNKHQPSIAEHPDKKATWKFLPLMPQINPLTGKREEPSQMEYRKLPDEAAREAYLEKHKAVIQASYDADKRFYDRLPASSKVPRLRPSLIDRPELMVEKPVYVLGGRMSRGIAENFRGAKPDYVPGDDPASILKNFEEVVKRNGAEKLKDASAVLTFDRDLFVSQTPLEQHVENTKTLLTRLNVLGLKITVLSPLKTWQKPKNLMDPEENRIRNNRTAFWEELSRMRSAGLITSLVDLGDATQANNTLGTNEALLTTENGKQVLNAQGIQMAVNGAIMGINAAHGYDGGNFSTARYWPGGEDYGLGKTTITGKPVEATVAGAPLVDKSLRDAAAEKVRPKDPLDTLLRLDTELMGRELLSGTHDDLYKHYKEERFIPGMTVYSHPARKAVHEAFLAVQEAKDAGKDVTELTREFSRLASSVYVKLARIAIIHARELFEDPQYAMYRKDAYEHAKRNVENAEAANSFYHFYDSNIEGVKKEWKEFKERFKLR